MLIKRSLRIFSIIILTILILILFIIIGLTVYEPSLDESFSFSTAGKTIKLSDDRTLAYLESGDPTGLPVFFFHGAPGSRLDGLIFDELNQQLGIRMITLDRPGYGLSDFQENRTYIDWPDDVVDLADHLTIDRFAALGWSTGGPYAAAVAHEIPQSIAVVGIVAGECPYISNDFPQSVFHGDTFAGSGINKLFIWSANNGPWLMRVLFRIQRVMLFRDPTGVTKNAGSFFELAKDKQFFTRDEYSAGQIEALRQGVEGWTRDFTLERENWPFKLEEIHKPKVLVFHGKQDKLLPPQIAKYMCGRIPSCDEPMIYPGEGHSVVYYRYEEIIQAMLNAWK